MQGSGCDTGASSGGSEGGAGGVGGASADVEDLIGVRVSIGVEALRGLPQSVVILFQTRPRGVDVPDRLFLPVPLVNSLIQVERGGVAPGPW